MTSDDDSLLINKCRINSLAKFKTVHVKKDSYESFFWTYAVNEIQNVCQNIFRLFYDLV